MDDDDDDDDVNVNLLNDIKDKILLDDLDYIKLTLKNSATNSNIIDVTDISNILDEGDINNLLFYSISMKRLKIFEYFYNEHLYYKDDFYTFNEIYFLLIKENELSLFEYFLNNKIFIENENQINNLKIFLLKNFKIEVNLNFKSFFEIFIKYVEIKHKDYEELIFTLFIKNLNYCGSIEERFKSFNIKTEKIKSSDVFFLLKKTKKIIEFAKKNSKPMAVIIEAKRLCAHSKGDDYRNLKISINDEPLYFLKKELGLKEFSKIKDKAKEYVNNLAR